MEFIQYGLTTNDDQFSATNTLSADLVDPQTKSFVAAVPPGTTIHYQAVAENSLRNQLWERSYFCDARG